MREMGADSCIMQIPPESGPGEYSFQPIYREWVEDPVDQGAADSITFEVKHDGTVLNDLSNCCYVSAKGFPSENLPHRRSEAAQGSAGRSQGRGERAKPVYALVLHLLAPLREIQWYPDGGVRLMVEAIR